MKRAQVFVCFLIFATTVVSQESRTDSELTKKDELVPRWSHELSTCFLNSHSMQTLDQLAGPRDLIIIVSHAAAGERKSVGKRRLFNARLFLTAISTKARPVERILIAEGEISADRGYLDFFVAGSLEYRVYLAKNRDFLVQPCVTEKPCSEPDSKRYYPCK